MRKKKKLGQAAPSRRQLPRRKTWQTPRLYRPVPKGRLRFPWARWETQELLDVRLCDLGLTIKGTWLQNAIDRLHGELQDRGLRVRPHFWLGEEWFSPDKIPGVSIPFYLAHPRLIRLERSQMLEVEGGNLRACMKLLRHESGHAVDHAYVLHRRKRWQDMFGRSSQPYPDYYRPNPASRRYVQHLDLWYAQSHPDEDFAETFAVWLTPRSSWRKKYKGWKALKKLEYVDELLTDLSGVRPRVSSRRQIDALPNLRKTLREHYEEKRGRYKPAYTDQYDVELRRLFVDGRKTRKGQTAASFLRRHRSEIRQAVARWTGEYLATLDMVLEDMIGRCGELRLRAVGSAKQLKLDFAILLAAKTMHYVYRRRDWHTI